MNISLLIAYKKAYLDNQEPMLESDNFLNEQDVTLEQADVLLVDFISYIERLNKK